MIQVSKHGALFCQVEGKTRDLRGKILPSHRHYLALHIAPQNAGTNRIDNHLLLINEFMSFLRVVYTTIEAQRLEDTISGLRCEDEISR